MEYKNQESKQPSLEESIIYFLMKEVKHFIAWPIFSKPFLLFDTVLQIIHINLM